MKWKLEKKRIRVRKWLVGIQKDLITVYEVRLEKYRPGFAVINESNVCSENLYKNQRRRRITVRSF